jgi:uncharacterized protein YbjT (DUF2867 family)
MIVVTGATGFVGQHLIRLARAEGHAVRAVARDIERGRRLARAHGVELFHGNLLDAATLSGAVDGATCVIHLVGIIVEWKENSFERTHVQATANVLDAAKRAGVKRFLHLSALGARPNAPSRYHQTKWQAEELVRKSGLAWTIFRPGLIYGPGDHATEKLAALTRWLPVLPLIGDGRARIQPVAVETVAHCLLAAVKNDDAIGKTYDLCDPDTLTWNELYEKVTRACGRPRPTLRIPFALARLPAWFFERTLAAPPFTRDQLRMLQEDIVGDGQAARRDFAVQAESFEAGLARYLAR